MVRYCRVCDDEFRPDITVCSDCGAELVLQAEGVGSSGPEVSEGGADERSIPSGGQLDSLDSVPTALLVPVRTFDSLNDLEPAVRALAGAEILSRVLVQNGRYILLIHPDTVAQAQAALHAQSGATDAESDPGDDGAYSNCPACDTLLAQETTGACPECGLELSFPGAPVQVPEAD